MSSYNTYSSLYAVHRTKAGWKRTQNYKYGIKIILKQFDSLCYVSSCNQ